MKSFLLTFSLPILLVAKVDFVHQVMPILKKNCAECHTDGKKKGGLSMNTRSEFLAGGEGATGPIADTIALNAGAGLYVAGLQPTIKTGFEHARKVLRSGAAAKALEKWASVASGLANA